MMKFSTNMLFMLIMILSTILVVNSSSGISMWMGLEINMMSFIPLLYKSKTSNTSESCMMYFLIQSFSSMIFLFSILINSMMLFKIQESIMLLTLISISIKMGMAPFHFWFPEIMNKMSWNNCIMLMTWQKIAPLYIMSQLSNMEIINFLILASVITGAIGGLNQTSLRKILSFSSINHLGWMVSCLKFNNNMWLLYLILYSTIVIIFIHILKKKSAIYLNQVFKNASVTEKITMSFSMMSLGGLPPFLGFMPKWIVIQSMMYFNNILMMTIMVMMSLITLFYYMRMISSMLMINSSINKWMINKTNINLLIMNFINIILPMALILNMF
nr:NADH dehydrogenase subunit 2 [Cardiastethus sp.]